MRDALYEPIFVAGHNGMVGSAIVRNLKKQGYTNIITANKNELNLLDQKSVNDWFFINKPNQVYLAAAKVGGIFANNSYPAEFIYENIMIQMNVIHAAHMNNVQKLLFLGSSCIYPRAAEQPMSEAALLTGPLELTNEAYAIAKIAGIKACVSYNKQYGRDYRSVMPTNLYGPNDNFHPEDSHVIPALLRKFDQAKRNRCRQVEVWGSGNPRREFLHVDDMADACVYLMNLVKEEYNNSLNGKSHVNIGAGKDITIADLCNVVASVTNFQGEVIYNSNYPDGAPRKLMDISLLKKMGWEPKICLKDGLADAYNWYLSNRVF